MVFGGIIGKYDTWLICPTIPFLAQRFGCVNTRKWLCRTRRKNARLHSHRGGLMLIGLGKHVFVYGNMFWKDLFPNGKPMPHHASQLRCQATPFAACRWCNQKMCLLRGGNSWAYYRYDYLCLSDYLSIYPSIYLYLSIPISKSIYNTYLLCCY